MSRLLTFPEKEFPGHPLYRRWREEYTGSKRCSTPVTARNNSRCFRSAENPPLFTECSVTDSWLASRGIAVCLGSETESCYATLGGVQFLLGSRLRKDGIRQEERVSDTVLNLLYKQKIDGNVVFQPLWRCYTQVCFHNSQPLATSLGVSPLQNSFITYVPLWPLIAGF
jgi:hypothetical protein